MLAHKLTYSRNERHPIVNAAFRIADDMLGYEFVVTMKSGIQFRGAPVPLDEQEASDMLELLSGVVIWEVEIAAITVVPLL